MNPELNNQVENVDNTKQNVEGDLNKAEIEKIKQNMLDAGLTKENKVKFDSLVKKQEQDFHDLMPEFYKETIPQSKLALSDLRNSLNAIA